MVVELYPVAGRSTRGLLRIWYIGNFRGSVNDIQKNEWRKQPGTFVWTSLIMSAQVYLQYAPDSPSWWEKWGEDSQQVQAFWRISLQGRWGTQKALPYICFSLSTLSLKIKAVCSGVALLCLECSYEFPVLKLSWRLWSWMVREPVSHCRKALEEQEGEGSGNSSSWDLALEALC